MHVLYSTQAHKMKKLSIDQCIFFVFDGIRTLRMSRLSFEIQKAQVSYKYHFVRIDKQCIGQPKAS